MHQPAHQPPPQPPPRWGRFTAWTIAAAITAFGLGGGLAVLLADDEGGQVANPAACKAALTENLRKATAAGPDAPTAPAPPACLGLDHKTLEQITAEVVAEYWDSPEAEKAVEDAWREALESATAQP